MKVKFLGHASFLITSSSGTKIITDPYERTDRLVYDEINETADIVTVSHDHHDHGNTGAVKGSPAVVKGNANEKNIRFRGISTRHDDAGGSQRGRNTVFCFEVDGVKLCHLGDLGHLLAPEQVREIGAVDVLFIPVGGNYTIDAAAATKVREQLKPRVTIPMHFRNEKCFFPIAGVDDFIKGKANVIRAGSSEAEFSPSALPAGPQVMVLKHAK